MLNLRYFKYKNASISMVVFRRNFRSVDLNEPHMWYKDARSLKPRSIICHVGPTNSGKTYNALISLEKASKGIYCGPLRLLAWEVFEKLRSKGIICNLLTGQENEAFKNNTHISCTVEMADLSSEFACAVIDEAQLLGDFSRGWAWTQALLGLKALEIHLCGSPSMIPVITEICSRTGDSLTIKHYERLSLLKTSNEVIKSYRDLRPGDCVIGFSRKTLYDIKREIEKSSRKLRCCVIYGNLPPEARREQARLFNSTTSGYDVLVATDAIGMGLNLSIGRIIFTTLEKYDGRKRRKLTVAELKQIAGRAGRYGTAYEIGTVSAMPGNNIKQLKSYLTTDDTPIRTAGLFPSLEQLELLAVFLSSKVSSSELYSFWKETLETDFNIIPSDEDDEDEEAAMSTLSIGMILKQFPSITHMTESLQLFISQYRQKQKQQKQQQFQESHRPPLHYTASTSSTTQNTKTILKRRNSKKCDSLPSEESISINDSLLSDNNSYAKNNEEVDEDEEEEDDTINFCHRIVKKEVPLSVLLSSFRSAAELDESGLYFICELKEKISLAATIDDVPMSLRDKYLFCLAPVNVDNKFQLHWFRIWAIEYSLGGEVKLSMSIRHESIAKTPDDLLTLESWHQVFDLYIWLSRRFESFVDINEAIAESVYCARLVDRSLHSMSNSKPDRSKIYQKKVKSKQRVIVK